MRFQGNERGVKSPRLAAILRHSSTDERDGQGINRKELKERVEKSIRYPICTT
jgi:hypothetical protein